MNNREKLTKAQRKFLVEIEDDHRCNRINRGYDFDVLRGPEMAMARRLSAAGLLVERQSIKRGAYWDITAAGRSALQDREEGR